MILQICTFRHYSMSTRISVYIITASGRELGAQTQIESYSSNHATVSPSLHILPDFDQASSQSAAGDGNQAEIIPMDSSVYKAAAEGDVHALQQLPQIDLQEKLSPKKNSVLHIAAQFGQLRTVRWILGSPWSSSLLQHQNLKGDTPLHLAAREGHFLVLKALCDAAKLLTHDIENGISPQKAMLRLINKEGDTALHEAVRYNRCKVVKLLVAEDPDLFAYTENVCGGTPLYMAAERGFRKLVEVIIDNSCTSPAYSGFYGRTALHAAVIQNDSEMIKKILEWKPELTKEVDESGWSPLHYGAYFCCKTTIIRELLDKSDKCVPYLRIKDGNLTALHIAAARRHMKIVETLASRYPECCEEVDDKGNNVFHLAMMNTQPSAPRDLLKNRWMRSTGLMNEKNDEGNTPLHLLFSRSTNYGLVFLLRNYVDKMAVNNEKLTALDIFLMNHDACRCKYRLIKILGGKGLWPSIGPMGWFRKKNNDSSSSGSQGKLEGNKKTGCKVQQIVEFIKRSSETHLVVATLIATVAIAAGFTLPGGYDQSTGMAMLSEKASFRAFVVMDTLAMVLSVSAVFNYLSVSLHSSSSWLAIQVAFGFFITTSAMGAIVVAFMTGLYAVLPHSGIPIFICIFCCCFFLLFYFTIRQLLRGIIVRWRNPKDPGNFPWL